MRGADPVGAGRAGDGIRPPLRSAPEQREMALIGGVSFFLYVIPGSILQVLDLRWGLLAMHVLFIAGPALAAPRLFYLDARSVLPLRRPAPRLLAAAVLGAVGLNHILSVATAWQERLLPMPEAARRFFEDLCAYRGPADFAGLLLVFALVPAVSEELLFRGFLQSGIVRAYESGPKGVALGALVFAAFHLDPWRFPSLLVLGLFLGWLARAAGSLVPGMLAHALNNGLSLSLAAARSRGLLPLQPSWLTLAIALLLCVAALWLGGPRWREPALRACYNSPPFE
jgi:membrane protease YdiL (CAAX protease family)